MAIRENLARAREAAGMSQTALAQRSGVTQAMISRIELGVTAKPDADSVTRLARALGVTVERLLYGEEQAAPAKLRRAELAIPHDAPASLVDQFDQWVSASAPYFFRRSDVALSKDGSGPKNGDGPDGSGDVSQDGFFKIDLHTCNNETGFPWRFSRRGSVNMIPVAG